MGTCHLCNPADRATLPKVDRTAKCVLTVKELDSFMEVIKADPLWYGFFYIELTAGLRRDEICGLQWKNFDSETGRLQVRQTFHRKPGGGFEVGDTKTGTRKRKILLPESTADILRERQRSTGASAGVSRRMSSVQTMQVYPPKRQNRSQDPLLSPVKAGSGKPEPAA